MITFTITGDGEQLARLSILRSQLFGALERKINLLNTRLQQRIQTQKLSGQVLQQRSGKLKRSIEVIPATIDEASGVVSGSVEGAGGPAFYGRFHEFGTSKSYVIVPVNKQALSFLMGNRRVTVKSVLHPPIKERSFMRSAQAEMKEEFIAGMQETVNQLLSAKP
jgi:HK97 gp10 family phage protein